MKHETFPNENEPAAGDARREDARAALEIVTDVRVGYGPWQKARLSDVSATGFRIGWMPRAGEGNEVTIRLPGIEPLRATVRWKNGNAIGCQFARPLSIYVFEHLVRTAS